MRRSGVQVPEAAPDTTDILKGKCPGNAPESKPEIMPSLRIVDGSRGNAPVVTGLDVMRVQGRRRGVPTPPPDQVGCGGVPEGASRYRTGSVG